ncbi:unnamed protein product [Rhodiola kirilowii]
MDAYILAVLAQTLELKEPIWSSSLPGFPENFLSNLKPGVL